MYRVLASIHLSTEGIFGRAKDLHMSTGYLIAIWLGLMIAVGVIHSPSSQTELQGWRINPRAASPPTPRTLVLMRVELSLQAVMQDLTVSYESDCRTARVTPHRSTRELRWATPIGAG